MPSPHVPLEWSACYAIDRCAGHCAWMPCADLDRYMDPVQAMRHRLQCQACGDDSACSGTATPRSARWSRARFALQASGTAVADRCSTEMSTVLMAVLLLMIAVLAAAVCYFARRQSRLRELRGVRLSEQHADDVEMAEPSEPSAPPAPPPAAPETATESA